MLYSSFSKCGARVSAVSFGAMRWPSEEACFRIVNRGLDLGLNYVDCSTGYVGGQSLPWVGRAVAKRRGEILFSCKSSFGKAPSADETRAAIERSLRAASLEFFDFYQLWGLGGMDVLQAALKKGGFVEGVRKAQDDGLVRLGTGFTFHGPEEVFRAAVDSGEFCCATVSYSLLNRKEEDNIAYAGAHGVGVVIMNPLAGGILGLAGDPALDFLRGGPDRAPAYGALRFLHANPAISTAIVGFRAVEEVNQAVASLADVASLDEAWRREQIRRMDAVKLLEGDFCTGCGYCKECPRGFDPQKFMLAMRDFARYGVAEGRFAAWIHSRYAHMDPIAHLGLCVECGACLQKCPQHLPIVAAIRRAKKAMGVPPPAAGRKP